MKTFFEKYAVVALAAAAVLLLFLLVCKQQELRDIRLELRHAHDLIWLIHNDYRMAMKGDEATAIRSLERLQLPPGARSENIASEFVESERAWAIQGIIHILRNKTGRDFGVDAQKWIQAFYEGTNNIK